jgi:hypothetical protein
MGAGPGACLATVCGRRAQTGRACSSCRISLGYAGSWDRIGPAIRRILLAALEYSAPKNTTRVSHDLIHVIAAAHRRLRRRRLRAHIDHSYDAVAQERLIKLPDEDGVMKALRPFNIPPNDYMVPHPGSSEHMKSPEYDAKRDAGPVMIITVVPSGPWKIGKMMGMWFLFAVVVSASMACVVRTMVPPGGETHAVPPCRHVPHLRDGCGPVVDLVQSQVVHDLQDRGGLTAVRPGQRVDLLDDVAEDVASSSPRQRAARAER